MILSYIAPRVIDYIDEAVLILTPKSAKYKNCPHHVVFPHFQVPHLGIALIPAVMSRPDENPALPPSSSYLIPAGEPRRQAPATPSIRNPALSYRLKRDSD